MRILFVDIEWNQVENIQEFEEITQIGIIQYDTNTRRKGSFFRYVRPDNIDLISHDHYKLTHSNRNKLLQSKSLYDTMNHFVCWANHFDLVVTWNEENYLKFKEAHIKCNLRMNHHRVFFLQDCLAELYFDRKKNFKKCLKIFGISNNPKSFHWSKYDAELLMELYLAASYNFKRELNELKEDFVYCSSNSNILHRDGCHYIKTIPDNNLEYSSFEHVFSGERICTSCRKKLPANFSISNNRIIPLQKQFDDDVIEDLCERYGLHCNISYGVIFVRSSYASWRIYHNYKKVTDVYHENFRSCRSQKSKTRKKMNEGFHLQKIGNTTVEGVVKYISKHDQNFMGILSKRPMACMISNVEGGRL